MIYRDQLEAVYRLIEKPENWTQGVTARDTNGDAVNPRGNKAVCWCVIGAFMKLGLGGGWEVPTRAIMGDAVADGILHSGQTGGIAEFNDADGRTHAEVLALLKSAIERAPVRS